MEEEMITLFLVFISSTTSYLVGRWYGRIDGYVNGYLDYKKVDERDQQEWDFKQYRTN